MERKSLRYFRLGILFLLLDVSVGKWNLLPDFAGMLLLYASLQSHVRRTEAEEKIKPFLLLLAADEFLHWTWAYENRLEGLLVLAVYIYTIYVLLGEVAGRIRPAQPGQAGRLKILRALEVLQQAVFFLTSPYEAGPLNLAATLAGMGIWISILAVAFRIQACYNLEENRI